MYCRNCGREIPEGAICTFCNPVVADEQNQQSDNSQQYFSQNQPIDESNCNTPQNCSFDQLPYAEPAFSGQQPQEPYRTFYQAQSGGTFNQIEKKVNHKAVASLVCGLAGVIIPLITMIAYCTCASVSAISYDIDSIYAGIVISSVINLIAIVAGILAVVFGVQGRKLEVGRGMATAGLVLGIIGIVFSTIGLCCWSCLCTASSPFYSYYNDFPNSFTI